MVDRRIGQRHIEGHIRLARGERLQIGADLVADVAVSGHAVGADDAQIHLPPLLQQAARLGADNGMQHDMFGQFERCRSEEHTSELQSLMRTSYDVFLLKKTKLSTDQNNTV